MEYFSPKVRKGIESKSKTISRRGFVLSIAKAGFFGIILSRLVYLQLFKSKEFKQLSDRNRYRERIQKNAISFWLDLNIKTLISRVSWNKKRPLLDKDSYKKTMLDLYDKRKNIYKQAHHKIICDKMSKGAIVKKIIKLYEKH